VYCGKNLEREYLSYQWRKKRTGEVLDEPQDGNDHALDALRYGIDDLSKKRIEFWKNLLTFYYACDNIEL
jgi:phage terminase large subunit